MLQAIEETLNKVDQHMENINELLPGLPDQLCEDFLKQIQNAEESLEAAHKHLEVL